MPSNHYLLRPLRVPEYDEIAVKVESYYDRQTRSWVSFLVNKRGDQLGEALYDGNKPDRDASIRSLSKRIGSEVT